MGDKTSIEWTDATPVVDRGGRRTRFYRRIDPTRPGQQLRRQQASLGLKWCRGCRDWLPATLVLRQGVCQPCINEEYRNRYRCDEAVREKIKSRRDMRRRRVARMPAEARELILEIFDGECAYCPARADSWDHFEPVSGGGQTVPGNMLPACSSCNSRKRNRNPLLWLDAATGTKPFTVEYLTMAGAL